MVKLTQSLSVWLAQNHIEIYHLIIFGHLELFTQEMWDEYIAWCKTEEGSQYLIGGCKYREDWDGSN